MKIILSESQFQNLSKKEEKKILSDILNKTMPSKFSWWKKIEILSVGNGKNQLLIDAVLEVPEKWGRETWNSFNFYKPFPFNIGWETSSPEKDDYTMLGSFIDDREAYKIVDEIATLHSMITGESKKHVSISGIFLKFV